MDGKGKRQGLGAAVLVACLAVAGVVGAVLASADTTAGGCGYGVADPSGYCQPSSPRSHLVGSVQQAGTFAPLQYATVTALAADGQPYSATTNRFGAFDVTLPAGTYSVRVSRYGHATQWWQGAANVGDSTPVVIGDNATLGLGVVLAPDGETISGTVTEDGTGHPVAGACVQFSMVGFGGPVAPPDQIDGNCPGAFTGPFGQYVLGGFPAGPFEYVVQVSDPQGRYPTEYYLNQADVLNAALVTAPATVDVSLGPDDGDGVPEPPGVDGNSDGIPDDQQSSVTTLTTPIGLPVTIATPDAGYPLLAVTTTEPPADNPPPSGANLPVGVLGFTVVLPDGATSADVDVVVPAGFVTQGYFKLQNGVWSDFTANTTINGNVITLHLVDNGAGDADPTPGVIVDPGGPVVGYGFSGFLPPLGKGKTVKAGSTVPVKWQLTDAAGAPITDPATFLGLTVGPCGGGPATPVATPGSSTFKSLAGGAYQVNWKTSKWVTGCQTLTLLLNDGLGGRTLDIQLRSDGRRVERDDDQSDGRTDEPRDDRSESRSQNGS